MYAGSSCEGMIITEGRYNTSWARPPCLIRGKGKSGVGPQSCPLAQDEPDQDEVLERGISSLVQVKGPDIQAEQPCVRKQAVPVM